MTLGPGRSASLASTSQIDTGSASISPESESLDNLLYEHKPWPVRVYTLGSFDVVRHNESVRFARKVQRRPLALLKAVIAFGGQQVSEARIIDALWPDADGDAAHFALTSAVFRLRQLLGQRDLIIRCHGMISLDVRHIWVDALTVERLLERSEHFTARSDHAASARLVLAAVELHKGGFLRGDVSAPWAQPYASRLSRWLLNQVILVGKNFEAVKRPEDASRCYERALRLDPCAEDACRRLMIIYHRIGRPAEVVNVYQQCRDALSRRLGMSPAPQTAILMKELIAG